MLLGLGGFDLLEASADVHPSQVPRECGVPSCRTLFSTIEHGLCGLKDLVIKFRRTCLFLLHCNSAKKKKKKKK